MGIGRHREGERGWEGGIGREGRRARRERWLNARSTSPTEEGAAAGGGRRTGGEGGGAHTNIEAPHQSRIQVEQLTRNKTQSPHPQVTMWKGDIRDYKALLAKKMGLSGVPGKK